jgi:hypothetical protein
MRIILKPMGAFILLASILVLAMGSLYAVSRSRGLLPSGPKLTAIPEMLTMTRLPAGFALSPQAQVYQAEDAKVSGPIVTNRSGSTAKDVAIKRTAATNASQPVEHKPGGEVPGYSGTGFADYQNYTDDYVEWSVTVPSEGDYRLIFRYAAATTNGVRALKITYGGEKGLDQVVAARLIFPNLENWSQWSVVTTKTHLKAGVNKIRATACDSSGPNIDALIIDK